jgi:hypothetical protein
MNYTGKNRETVNNSSRYVTPAERNAAKFSIASFQYERLYSIIDDFFQLASPAEHAEASNHVFNNFLLHELGDNPASKDVANLVFFQTNQIQFFVALSEQWNKCKGLVSPIDRSELFTVAKYAFLKGIDIDINTASKLGRKAAAICKRKKIKIDTIPDERFGFVNTYPEDVLIEVFKNL